MNNEKPTNLIELHSVTKNYGVRRTKVTAINNINTSFKQGEFVSILGKSGSGKSTLLSLISGLEKPTEGKIIFRDKNMSTLTENDLAKLRRSDIGIVFQHFYLMDTMTAIDNVEMPLLISGENIKERRKWASKLLSLVGLSNRATHYPNELSGGERQRVGIARALANRASVIIADEPTGDLDSETGKKIIELLYNLHLGNIPELDWKPTIILVTHDERLLRDGMRRIIITDGSISEDTIISGKQN